MLSRHQGVELVALTSPRNADFVAGLGIYDRTIAYDAIDSLERGPATFVDIAGDSAVRHAVHSHYGDNLAHSMTVGLTHWEELGAGGGELPGPAPVFFFAPDRVAKRTRDWGSDGFPQRVAESWTPFTEWIAGWLEIVQGEGFDGLQAAYLEVLAGAVAPQRARVVQLS